MPLDLEDRLAIADLIHQHGHLTDAGALDRYGELFASDVRYDVTALGGGVLVGVEALRDHETCLAHQPELVGRLHLDHHGLRAVCASTMSNMRWRTSSTVPVPSRSTRRPLLS